MHTHVHTCTHTQRDIHTHVQTYIDSYIHMHTCTYTHAHIQMHTYTHIHSYIHMRTHTCTHAHTHALTYTHARTHIHIHTHICTHVYTHIHITYTRSFKCCLHISRYLGTQIQIPVTPLLQVGPLRGAGGKAGLQLAARILPTAGLWVESPPSGDQCGFGFVLFFYCFPNSLYCVHLGRFVV